MTTHVFVVDKITFPIHLEYLFTGTGAKDSVVDFNGQADTSLHHGVENMLVEMISDASRIRKGDYIIFYVRQSSEKQKTVEGKFYGIFKAKKNCAFLDNNDNNQYLKDKLGKSLTFRTLIEPYIVYPEGVTEWDALDDIRNICSPNQMLWSLIYRKLKANRGNTMITIYESERLCQLIRNKNKSGEIDCHNKLLSFDVNNQKIVVLDKPVCPYEGRQTGISVLPRLAKKAQKKQSFEIHLQAYITQNIGLDINKSLDKSVLTDTKPEWIGNEVFCSLGLRKMDIAISAVKNEHSTLCPIELKSKRVVPANLEQIQKYIEWIRQYYLPNRPSDVCPILIGRQYEKRNAKYKQMVESMQAFNRQNSSDCKELVYIEFSIEDDNITFNRVPY